MCGGVVEVSRVLIGYGAGSEIYEEGDRERYVDENDNLMKPSQLVYGLDIRPEPTHYGPSYTYKDSRYPGRSACSDSLIKQANLDYEEVQCGYCNNVDLRPAGSHAAPCLRCGAI